MRTRTLIAREIAVARIAARRGTRAVLLFTAWLLVTWLGPELSPPRGWSIWATAGAVAGYSVLTVAALAAVWWSASRVLFTGVLRRVVSAYLMPFWMVGFGCLCAGGAVWSALDDPIASVWLGLGCALTMLTAAYALARLLEVRELRHDHRQIAHAPTEVALGTWKRELHARLDAHGSIRFG